MPHDKDGRNVEVGHLIDIRFQVTGVTPGDGNCTGSLLSLDKIQGDSQVAITVNLKDCELVTGSGSCGLHETSPRQDFPFALEQVIRGGVKISRANWNGKDQFVFAQAGYPDGIAINQNTADATGLSVGTVCQFVPYLMLKNAQGDFCPWVPSQGDLFANDWIIESL